MNRRRRGSLRTVPASLVFLFLLAWTGGGTVLMMLMVESVQAQVPLPPIFDPGGRSKEGGPLRREEPTLKPKPAPLEPTKPAPPSETQERLPPVRVFVREYKFSGHSVFTTNELQAVAAPYVNRQVTTEDLESLRNAVTLLYIQRGYVTSGAILPDQAVTDGVILIQIIEGKLSEINVEGARWLRPSYYQRRLALSAGPPVNIYNLQERLQLLQQDPRIQRINAELRRGTVSGESELNVRVSEYSPFKAWLEVNNYQPPAVRAERILGTVAHDSLTGNGDRLRFTYGQSIPINTPPVGVIPLIDTSYSIPFTSYDTTFTAAYRRTDFSVVTDPFQALDIQGHIQIIGFTIQQPVYRTINHQVNVGVQGEYLYNKNTLLGQPFDFFAGYQNGVANIASLRFLQDWTYRSQDTVIGARSRFSVGLNVLDATINPDPAVPDGQFFSWLGQFQALRRYEEWAGTQLLGRIDMQFANDKLFPLEQVPVGGRYSVRGYREISLLRDDAFMFSVESRLPIARWLWDKREDLLQLAPFIDYARSWAAKGTTDPPLNLLSAGSGLRIGFLPDNRGYFEIYWGYRIRGTGTNNPPYNVTGNLQDHGVHLGLVIQLL